MSDEASLSRGKERLPKGWSYPLSAHDVERQLQDLKVPDELTMSFHLRSFALQASEHLALARAEAGLPVLEASYFNVRSRIPSTALGRSPGRYDRPYWSIHVYAVPSQARQACREALLKAGVPAICEWLTADRPDTWYEGRRALRVFFGIASGALSLKEST